MICWWQSAYHWCMMHDDACLVFQSKSVTDIEINTQILNKYFPNIWDWFADNKLSIQFGEDKTNSIHIPSKRNIKKLQKLVIIYNNIRIKEHSPMTYLDCILEKTMAGESMAYKIICKVNARLKFLRRKIKYLTPNRRQLLWKALIQPHFDYACSTWYSNLSEKENLKKLENKIQAL